MSELYRVRACQAEVITVMMTDADRAEVAHSGKAGATLRTVLALRHVLHAAHARCGRMRTHFMQLPACASDCEGAALLPTGAPLFPGT